MNRSLLPLLPALAGALLLGESAQAQRNSITGRNIALQDTWALSTGVRTGAFPGGVTAVGAWTTCCNPGTNPIPFQAAMSQNHGFIHFLVVRESEGRLMQISNRGFVKHTFGSSNDPSPCGTCAGPGSFDQVEVGCNDTYAASQAMNHFNLGPPDEIDPWFGTWNSSCSLFDAGDPPVAPAQMCDNVRSLDASQSAQLNQSVHNQNQIRDVELDVPGATFWWQAGYLIPSEFESVRNDNIGSRGFVPTWTGTNWSFSDTGSFQQGTILQRWTGATVDSATNGTNDGRFFVAVKVTGPVDGMYHYEYAVHNRDNKRGLGGLRIPVCPTAQVANFGFHDVDQDPLNQWTGSKQGGEIVFSTPSNPLRWNSLFNFWFDCDAAPVTGTSLSLDQFDLGQGAASVLVSSTAPGGLYNEYLGDGCGSGTTPTLFAMGAPDRATLGNTTFQVRCGANPASAVVAMAYSTQDGSTALGSGCTLYAASLAAMQPLFLLTADAQGNATAPLAVPNLPIFEGLHLDLQAARIQTGGALLGAFDLSNGLRVRIGNAISDCP
ncbi:MAG: hypothetical protein AB7O97_18295 [Planctomycetota bacterium]